MGQMLCLQRILERHSFTQAYTEPLRGQCISYTLPSEPIRESWEKLEYLPRKNFNNFIVLTTCRY